VPQCADQRRSPGTRHTRNPSDCVDIASSTPKSRVQTRHSAAERKNRSDPRSPAPASAATRPAGPGSAPRTHPPPSRGRPARTAAPGPRPTPPAPCCGPPPNRRAISLIGTPSARCNRRISAQFSTVNTLQDHRRRGVNFRTQGPVGGHSLGSGPLWLIEVGPFTVAGCPLCTVLPVR
jgi:hypothetical protein